MTDYPPTPEPFASGAESPPPETPVPRPLAEAESIPWSLWDVVVLLVFGLLAFVAANLLALASYTLLHSYLGWHLSPKQLSENAIFVVAIQSLFYVFLIGFIYFLVAAYHRQSFWATVRWRVPAAPKALAFVLGGFLMSAAVALMPPLFSEEEQFPLRRLFDSPASAYVVGAFAILVAPLVEELIFRGVLFAIFERQAGVVIAVLTTALLFAGLHVPEYWRAWNQVLMISLVGLVFSVARGLTRSLVPSVLLHLGYNSSMMVGLYIQTHHFHTL